MTSSPAQEMHSNQNRKSLYFLVNQVKDFQAAQGKKKKRKLEEITIRTTNNFSDLTQCKPLNLSDKLPYCGNNLHRQ